MSTMIKNIKRGIKYKKCECFLEYTNFKDNLVKHKCLFYDKNYQKKFHENLKKRGFNTYTIHNTHDISKFSLLLQKGVNPYQSIND